MASTWGLSWGSSWGTSWDQEQTEVPDVVGETQAAGTSTLEGDGFVVAVETAFSDSVAEGLIISQSPEGGEFAASGSTVAIVVSLGPEPVAEQPISGHFVPHKDYRPELDEKRRREKRELRELIDRAAGLIEEVLAPEAQEPKAVERQAAALNVELGKLREYAKELGRDPKRELAAIQERVDGLIAKAVDDLIVQIADLLTDLIQEIAEEDDAA